MNICILAILVLGLISFSGGANILFFFGLSTASHRTVVWPLVEKLTDLGHNVTFFQPYKNRHPNPKVQEITPKLMESFLMKINLLTMRLENGMRGVQKLTFTLPQHGVNLCQDFLSNPEIIEWINKSTYDLVMIDSLYNDCGLGLAHKFGAKHAIFACSSTLGWWSDSYGYPWESNWIPELHLSFPLPLTFLSRVLTTLVPFYFTYHKRFSMYPQLETIFKEKLNIPDLPPLHEIEKNTSLILMNTHFSEEVARSLPPLIVPVGGIHCTDSNKPLPKEFIRFIEQGGNEGFIYVSFGSVILISSAPEALRNAFFNAIRNTKTQFLWKWEGPRPNEMPSNVLTAEWMPQQAILAHPKIRGFITHGGLLGMQEAIYHAVPMIAIPVFAEQDYNAERLQRTGRGITLQVERLTQTQIEDAINKILTDSSYKKNIKEASKRFKDRPQTPLDTAVWWVEYVLRHEDTSSLRPLAANQTWYERRLLDVWAFLFGIIVLSLVMFILLLKKLLAICLGKNKKNNTKNTRVAKPKVAQKSNTKSKAKKS